MRVVLNFYGRVARRGVTDARRAITRGGVVVGLVFSLATATAQAAVDSEFDLARTAIAAVAGAVALSLAFLVWHMIRAPMVLGIEREREITRKFEQRTAGLKLENESVALALRKSEVERARLQEIVDGQAPKRALLEQLRKADAVRPILFKVGSKEETEQRRRDELAAIRAWASETRAVLNEVAPQYADQFVTTARLPLDLPFAGKGEPPPRPGIKDLLAYLKEARASLSAIIRQL